MHTEKPDKLIPIILAITIIICGSILIVIAEREYSRKAECESYGGYYIDTRCWALMEPIQLKGDTANVSNFRS